MTTAPDLEALAARIRDGWRASVIAQRRRQSERQRQRQREIRRRLREARRRRDRCFEV